MIFDESIPVGPKIEPATPGKRPLLSVMIPVARSTDRLLDTVNSVLSQDLGPDIMQIEVIDNAADASPEQTRNQFHGRVEYYRQPAPVSSAKNWNTCLDRARGEWVHLLLANDLVQPHFYEAFQAALTDNEHLGAFTSRYAIVDRGGVWLGLSELHANAAGVLFEDFVAQQIAGQRLHLSSLLVRRDFYEESGGFQDCFQYCADWDMCNRLALTRRIFYDPRFLVCVRGHEEYGLARLDSSGEDIAEEKRCLRAYTELFPDDWERKLRRMGIARSGLNALRRAHHYRAGGNRQAARQQFEEAIKCGLEMAHMYVEGLSVVRFLGRLADARRPLRIRTSESSRQSRRLQAASRPPLGDPLIAEDRGSSQTPAP